MDSWTLQGDSYSFLRSAPRNFSLCHRDGTPNHVEIFDIINVPTQRSAISETTCLCDIFGDDCESQSLSSSPAVVPFVPSQRELDETAATSPSVDDQNDSSGSYHTAPGSSEGEEGPEDSREGFYSPTLQSEHTERRSSEGKGPASGLTEVSEESCPNLDPKSQTDTLLPNTSSPTSPVIGSDQTALSSGHNSPYILSPEGRLSSLSSSSFEKRHSPLSPDSQADSETEPKTITPSFRDRHSSSSHQSLTPSPSFKSRERISSSSSESGKIQSLVQNLPDSGACSTSQNCSPFSELTSEDFKESNSDSRPIHSSPLPSPSGSELLFHSRENLVSPQLRNTPSFSDTQASSPFPELRGRVSLPDLLSRGSSPETEDFDHTPVLVSAPYTPTRISTASPEGQNKRSSLEPGSVSSTPRLTPPSPVISITTSPELVNNTTSPEFRYTGHSNPSSPSLLCTASPTKAQTRTPSRDSSPNPRFSEIKSQASSPVISYSLSPSPGIRENCSPTEYRYTSPSPEIRITASSPEINRKKDSPEVEERASLPLLPEPPSAAPRSHTSSPHITGISYSVVQPEDRYSPAFPELSRLGTSEPDQPLMSSEARSLTASRNSVESSISEFTGTPGGSPHTSSLARPVSGSELTQPRYQTPSPQLNYQTPSPEPRNQTPSFDTYQSVLHQSTSRDSSPVTPSSSQSHLHSPAILSTESDPLYTQQASSTGNTPEVQRDSPLVDITDAQSPKHLLENSVSPSLSLQRGENLAVTDFKQGSPVVAFQSPVTVSPVVSEGKRSTPSKRGSEGEETLKEISLQNQSSRAFVSQEKQNVSPHFFQREDPHNSQILSKKRLPVQRAASKSPVQKQEVPQPQVNTYAQTSETVKPICTPQNSRRQLLSKSRREKRERSTEDMSRHLNRRRTPSPPLTRFTPVHIIAPEKPYRHWQNRSHSPSQVVTSSPSGDLKKAVTHRESPDVAPVDNNSQTPWVRAGWQLEREMQLEQEREIGRERKKEREMKKEKKREERLPEKGEGWQGDTSYRGEQVELSFSARNRKGPVSRAAAPTSRESRQGLPTVHSYSEGLLATRQLQQQQSLLRLASQQDTSGGGASRRQPPAPHSKNCAPGRVAANRPCRSSSSSMGSELDEADNEVKWFTDLAFRSLSSPEVDYLDMYNSSHRSSTNISQPSTQESPAGVNVAWLAYADFKGSAPKLNQDELTFQQPSVYCSDGLDPAKRYELGSFECVDVAVEREDSRKARRGVPKRQIQLKRRDNGEGKQDESSENSSPGLPVMGESPSQERHARGAFVRQHSTPAAMQECYPSESSPDPLQPTERKSKLQKSASMDETCSKTKMASCLIKSVLSKKMQSIDRQPDEQVGEEISSTSEENSPQTETAAALPKVSPKHSYNPSSPHQPDYNLSSEGLPVRGEPSTKEDAKPPKGKPSNRPSSSSSSRSVNFSLTDSEEADSQGANATSLRTEMRSELKVPFDSKQPGTGVQRADDSQTCRREGGDSANATVGNTGAPSATGARITQVRETNRDQECENTEDHKQLQPNDKGACVSKTQEITIRAVEKKKASLNVCLTPEAENKPEPSLPDFSVRGEEERRETPGDEKTKEEENDSNNVKAPIHKVRDVRRLVKNTYNLSFKAASACTPSEEKKDISNEEWRDFVSGNESDVKQESRTAERREEKEEEFLMEEKEELKVEAKDLKGLSSNLLVKGKSLSSPQPMQIECKAVCWKEDKSKMSTMSKDQEKQGDRPQASLNALAEDSRDPQPLSSQSCTTGDTSIAKLSGHNVSIPAQTQETMTEIHKVSNSEEKTMLVKTDRKPPMLGGLPKLPSKEREVSTAVVLIREGSNKTKTSASQEDVLTPLQAPVPSLSPEPLSPGGHSVSMLLKEKGYQADIGAVVSDSQNTAGAKAAIRKHVNSLEIPLQTNTASDGSYTDSYRDRTSPITSATSGPSAAADNADSLTKTTVDEAVVKTPPEKDTTKQKSFSLLRNTQERTAPPTKPKDLGDFESVKRLDPTFPPRSPAIRRFKPQPIEVKSLSKEPQKKETPPNPPGSNRPQTIEVKSIAKNSQKPVVPPKPSCKFKPADLGATPNEAQRPPATTSAAKLQGEERSQTIVVSSPTIYRKIPSDSTSTSNYSRKLAVSAVSSLKPPANKPASAVHPDPSNQSSATLDAEASNGGGQQQQPTGSTENCVQTPVTSAGAPPSTTGSGVNSAPALVSDPKPNQISGPDLTGGSQPSQPAAADPDNQLRYPRPAYPHEQALPATSNSTKQPAAVSTTQLPRYSHQPFRRSLSSERSQRTDDLRFYASDDPPSYDERESFSPLMLPDLTPLRSNRYQPSSRPPPCSCTAGCPSHPGLTPPHHHRSPHTLTPPAPPHSPGQTIPYPMVQPHLRPHQCRPEPPPMSYQPGSPKSSPLGPNQPPTMYQPLHQAAPCPPHPSLMQTCPADRPMQPPQHIDPRRPPVHRSPHQQPHGMSGAPYGDSGHSHSPGLPAMDPQYLCGPQSLGPSYGSEYGGDSSSLYSESSYAQTPRRVLMDPETGKYFYIEVPVQPLRKMLFDPETGQYVEVLIPQQAVSHSGLYPPSAAPYPPLPNPNIYAPAPQYMPYAAPPPPAHPQSQPQPPRYPEASATATMHPSGPGVSYRNPSSQGPKPEPQPHPPLDHSYLESMYYVPTGMNASPNPTPPDYYHKHPPNLPPAGGKRS